jgi:hypothetical protein
MEDFWNRFRGTGHGPTHAEYDEALQNPLEHAGQASDEAMEPVKLAQEARRTYGYFDGAYGLIPKVPDRMPLPR